MRTPDLFAAVNAPRPFDGDPTGSSGPADGTVATTDHRHTFAAKVAAMFKAAPGEWIDGREVLKIGGVYGWRTRISDCRRAPYNLKIVNRQRRVGRYTISEYRFVADADPHFDGAA